MSLLKSFSPLRFIILNFVIGALTFFSFLTAFGKDEGTLGHNFFLNFMADTFYVFRFPMHVLFWKYMDGGAFFLGLFINILFYAVFVETVINILSKRRKKQLLKRPGNRVAEGITKRL
jgi:hypothetical protein